MLLKKATKRVVILRVMRVILVIVAAGALEGQRHEGGAEGVDAVRNTVLPEFLQHGAALLGLAVDAVEGGGEALVRVGFSSRSPASCSVMNWSKGRLLLKALITQSR